MTNTFISLLFAAAGAAAIQLAPATSYIYRSDNNGPASLIQLGGHGYQQPHAFAPPLPVAQPILGPYNLAPAPLPYIAAQPVIVEDVAEVGESEGYGHGGHEFEKGGGSDFNEQHHAAHGEKGSKGYSSKGHHAKGASGHYGKEHEEGYHHEKEGEKGSHHDEADSHGNHYESRKHYKGGDHGHKKHHSKGEEVTGYHKVFNKDEFKKDHDFYDVADNSGHFNKHGYEKKQHGSEEGGHKKGEKHASGHDSGDYGKAGYQSKGHIDEAEAEHSAEEGQDSHYNHEENYAKKGESGHEKEYSHEDGDDDDDNEEYYDDK